jgi:hypothetical protein
MTQPPAPPPPPPSGGVAPHERPYGGRPAPVTTAVVFLIVLGGLRILFALLGLVLLIGASDELSGESEAGAVVGVIVVAILITAGVGILQILGGVNTLRLRRRAFVLAIVGCSIGIVLAILGLLGGGSGAAITVAINVLVLIGDIVALVLVAQNRRHLTLP